MRTFEEFVDWVKETRSKLDEIWERAGSYEGVYRGVKGQDGIYAKFVEEFFGRSLQNSLHPRGDNFQFFLDENLESVIDRLKGVGYVITREEERVNYQSAWSDKKVITSSYRLAHPEGVISIQAIADLGRLLFYFDQSFDSFGNTAIARFTSYEESKYFLKKELTPNLEFNIQTALLVNPYGFGGVRTSRECEIVMEDRFIELMNLCITKKIGGFYQSRGSSWYCLINAPETG